MFIGGLPDTPHQPMFGQTFDVAEMFYDQLFVGISGTYGVIVLVYQLFRLNHRPVV